MELDGGIHHREAHAGAVFQHGVAARAERHLENLLELFLRNAGAVVAQDHLKRFARICHAHVDDGLGHRVLRGVAHEIDESVEEHIAVADHAAVHAVRRLHRDRGVREHVRAHAAHVFQERYQRQLRALAELRIVERGALRGVQPVLDQIVQLGDRFANLRIARARIRFLIARAEQTLGVAVDHIEQRAELVRGHRAERLLEIIQTLLIRQRALQDRVLGRGELLIAHQRRRALLNLRERARERADFVAARQPRQAQLVLARRRVAGHADQTRERAENRGIHIDQADERDHDHCGDQRVDLQQMLAGGRVLRFHLLNQRLRAAKHQRAERAVRLRVLRVRIAAIELRGVVQLACLGELKHLIRRATVLSPLRLELRERQPELVVHEHLLIALRCGLDLVVQFRSGGADIREGFRRHRREGFRLHRSEIRNVIVEFLENAQILDLRALCGDGALLRRVDLVMHRDAHGDHGDETQGEQEIHAPADRELPGGRRRRFRHTECA